MMSHPMGSSRIHGLWPKSRENMDGLRGRPETLPVGSSRIGQRNRLASCAYIEFGFVGGVQGDKAIVAFREQVVIFSSESAHGGVSIGRCHCFDFPPKSQLLRISREYILYHSPISTMTHGQKPSASLSIKPCWFSSGAL